MQFVRSDCLKPGMRLAKPIYNKNGVMLYERNSKLTPQGIESIRNFELIGIYILEPAEPAPPLSKEDIAFEQFQTIAMFQLRDCMKMIANGRQPENLTPLIHSIISRYGSLDHKLNFTQNLRSPADYVYKHSISTAILTAMIAGALRLPAESMESSVMAALLYDFGELFIPPEITEKSEPLTEDEQKVIRECRKKGFDYLAPERGMVSFPKDVLKIISQMIYLKNTISSDPSDRIIRTNGAKILQAADRFDRMTAMNLTEEPVSELMAIRYLKEYPEEYDTKVVRALAKSINIIPRGSCVDLSNGQKAMVLEENHIDYSKPLVLEFSSNKVYDLRIPAVYERIQIQDIMKTMDNRISIDEDTLKQFTADEHIQNVVTNFRRKLQRIAARKVRKNMRKKLQ